MSTDTQKQKAIDILEEHIEEQNLEYADNYRVARNNDSEALDEFEAQSMNGCCGSYETEVVIDGETWMIGCNYGH